MTLRMQYKSKLMAAIHETAEDLHAAKVMPVQTLQEFNALCCLPMQEMTAKEADTLRLREEASQELG